MFPVATRPSAMRALLTLFAIVATLAALGCQAGSDLFLPTPGEFTNSIGMEFALVPAGEFDMGTPGVDALPSEQPVTRVRISRPFYLGKYEVTQGQWRAVMSRNPSMFRRSCGPECPVETVSWNDVQEFVRKLNEKEETTLYRLPTEAEWEYAARGATAGERYSDDLSQIAWFANNSRVNPNSDRKGPHPVGRKEPNEYGLYDMLGNVWEWVQDWEGPLSGGHSDRPCRSEDRPLPGEAGRQLGKQLQLLPGGASHRQPPQRWLQSLQQFRFPSREGGRVTICIGNYSRLW